MDAKRYEQYRLLGLNIAYYRKMRRFSQLQLAEKIHISRTHMSRIETADCAVSLDIIFSICDALHISPAQLFEFPLDNESSKSTKKTSQDNP